MRTIHKYAITTATTLRLPVDAQFLHAGQQGKTVYAWFLVDMSAPLVAFRRFDLVPTGGMIADGIEVKHLATVQMSDGLVWHLFEQLD